MFSLMTALVAPAALAQGRTQGSVQPQAQGAPSQSQGSGVQNRGNRSASPARQAIARGQAAYVARNFDEAMSAFQEALTSEAERPEATLDVGYTQQARGDHDAALSSYREAERLAAAANDHWTRARAMQAIANLLEARGRWDEASTAWQEFATFADRHTEVANAAFARARVEAIRQRAALNDRYAVVRQRIEERRRANARGPQQQSQ